MAKLIAQRRYSYAGRGLRAGDEFEASEIDAQLLITVGAARQSVEGGESLIAAAKRRPPAKRPRGTKSRQYRRRDLVAEQP
jgi:hypothetical protein